MSERSAPQRNRRWLVALLLALALSFGLNLLFAGYLLGRSGATTSPASHHPRARGGPAQLGHFLASRSAERQASLKPAHQAYRRALREAMRALGQARRQLGAALQSEPWDEARVSAAMEAVDQAMLESSKRHHEAMLPLLQALTPEERRLFARLRHRPRGEHQAPATMAR
jgi:Spy/CpxP family protein refolding chaperone